MRKAKAIRMPGKKRPAASRFPIQRPPTTEALPRNHGRNTKPSASQPIRQAAEGLDHRFLRSQPRVIGPGSLRRARPRRSNYNRNTHRRNNVAFGGGIAVYWVAELIVSSKLLNRLGNRSQHPRPAIVRMCKNVSRRRRRKTCRSSTLHQSTRGQYRVCRRLRGRLVPEW